MTLKTGITKILSINDTGQNDTHQAGILVPKVPDVLAFFPKLDATEKNPRAHLRFIDDSGTQWTFAFIYYNNRLFGGSRNEYRLTHMTKFIRQNDLKPGDSVILYFEDDDTRRIRYTRAHPLRRDTYGVLRLGSAWKTIYF